MKRFYVAPIAKRIDFEYDVQVRAVSVCEGEYIFQLEADETGINPCMVNYKDNPFLSKGLNPCYEVNQE